MTRAERRQRRLDKIEDYSQYINNAVLKALDEEGPIDINSIIRGACGSLERIHGPQETQLIVDAANKVVNHINISIKEN